MNTKDDQKKLHEIVEVTEVVGQNNEVGEIKEMEWIKSMK